MGKPSAHKASIVMDECWVCAAKFAYNGGTEQREDHHMIPRAYGGVDGPTVTLCDTDHTRTHRIAECLIHSKPFFEFTKGLQQQQIKKLLYLANLIQNAHEVMKNDPNKAVTVAFTLTAKHKHMIEQLKKARPNLKSRETVLLAALEAYYARHFITK